MSHSIDILPDGTRIDLGDGMYDFPLSIDLKITNFCKTGCPWCHESSSINGRHSSVDQVLSKLSGLPKNTEIALGGGNPLEHPDLEKLIDGLIGMGYIVNMTVRDTDVPGMNLPKGITGLGISITPGISPASYLGKISSLDNIVFHLILGINSIKDYREAQKYSPRVLWLGFKDWGRNRGKKLPDLREIRREIVQDLYYGRSGVLAFDNLAITQLDLKSAFLKKEWDKFYLGQEFTSSMYVDAVEGKYSGFSTSENRISWNDISLIDYFKKYASSIE